MKKIDDLSQLKTIAGIYGIKNTTNGKWYVGSAANTGNRSIGLRLREHFTILKRNGYVKRNPHLQSSYNKYGVSVFELYVIEVVGNPGDIVKFGGLLWEREKHWMAELDSINNGYNIGTEPGRPMLGVKFSEDHKKALGQSQKTNWNASPDRKRQASIKQKRQMADPRYKCIASETAKQAHKGNKYCIGRVMSKTTRDKIGKANTGNTWSDEAKKTVRLKPPLKGKYKGVSFNTHVSKYKASLYVQKEMFLGWFDDPVIAAENYDYYAIKHYGRENCWLNFSDKDYSDFVPQKEQPKKPYACNTSGITGVSWDKRGKWYAWIRIDGKMTNLGRYINKEDAIAARKSAEQKIMLIN